MTARRPLSLLVLGLLVAHGVVRAEGTGKRLRSVAVLALGADGSPDTDVAAANLMAVERGLVEPVVSVHGGLTWTTTVWASLPASDARGLARSSRLLAERAASLAALGPVEVILSDSGTAEPLGGPTRDAGELRQILADLELESDGAGELLELRSTFRAALRRASAAEERERLALDSLSEEILLVDDERTNLLAWLADATLPTPTSSSASGHLLVLLADVPLEADAAPYAGAATGARGPLRDLLAEASSALELGPVLAAAGWTTVPLLSAGGEISAATTAFDELARATGGRVAADASALDSVLAELAHYVAVAVATRDDTDGKPYPFAVRIAGRGGEVRGPEWGTTLPPEELSAARARRLLFDDDQDGNLAVEASLRLEEAAGRRRGQDLASVEALVDLERPRPELDTSAIRTTVLLERIDGRPTIVHRLGSGRALGDARRLLLRATLPLPDDVDRIVVLVEDLAGGAWGGTIAELTDEPLRATGGGLVAESLDLGLGGGDTSQPTQSSAPLLRLLPPHERPAVGRQRFQVLVTNRAVAAVDFYLDGEKRDSDTRPPFSATLDLGGEVAPHTVRAVALDRAGSTLSTDELRLNTDDASLRVTLVDVSPTSDAVDLEATVVVPPGAKLERLELYYNEQLVTLLEGPPYRAHISRTARGGGDYVTVVAHLADGSRAEDVRLLDAPGAVERVDVNLVQLYIVVTDGAGQPVRDLDASAFRLSLGGEPRPIERFAVADDVPLVLGLMVDTSMSMDTIMPATKMAAIRFLSDTLSPIDRSFLVDFADTPRLVQTTTGELFSLVSKVGALDPSGSNTALYDAIVFSLLQFGNEGGRKALVLLSDGDDVNSRLGYRRVYETATAAGLPIYILGIAGLDPERPSFRKSDLEGIAAASGGRVFYIGDQTELGAAYDTISSELRSQYLLTFTTQRELTDKEVATIRVEVSGRGLKPRVVVGDR